MGRLRFKCALEFAVHVDVYFLDYDAKSATYGNQSAREQRRMLGARYSIYSVPDPDDERKIIDVKRTRVNDVIQRVGTEVEYVYDRFIASAPCTET